MDVFSQEDGKKVQQLHAPKWSGTYMVSYSITDDLTVDLTGQVYVSMRLIVLKNDFRPEYLPWYSIANIKVAHKVGKVLKSMVG